MDAEAEHEPDDQHQPHQARGLRPIGRARLRRRLGAAFAGGPDPGSLAAMALDPPFRFPGVAGPVRRASKAIRSRFVSTLHCWHAHWQRRCHATAVARATNGCLTMPTRLLAPCPGALTAGDRADPAVFGAFLRSAAPMSRRRRCWITAASNPAVHEQTLFADPGFQAALLHCRWQVFFGALADVPRWPRPGCARMRPARGGAGRGAGPRCTTPPSSPTRSRPRKPQAAAALDIRSHLAGLRSPPPQRSHTMPLWRRRRCSPPCRSIPTSASAKTRPSAARCASSSSRPSRRWNAPSMRRRWRRGWSRAAPRPADAKRHPAPNGIGPAHRAAPYCARGKPSGRHPPNPSAPDRLAGRRADRRDRRGDGRHPALPAAGAAGRGAGRMAAARACAVLAIDASGRPARHPDRTGRDPPRRLPPAARRAAFGRAEHAGDHLHRDDDL